MTTDRSAENLVSLTQEERNKFAAYLEQEAVTTLGLVEQMKNIHPFHEMLSKKMRTEALAMQVVAKILRETETMTL